MTGGLLTRLLAAALLAVGLAGLGLATPAFAHTQLTNAIPAEGATLTESPGTVQLTFTEPVDAELATVVVRGPDGENLADGPVRQAASSLMQPIASSAEAGTVTVAYRVISLDGHPVSGSYTFKVLRGDPDATPPADQGGGAAVPGDGDGSAGLSLTGPVLGGVLVLLLIVLGATVTHRRRTRSTSGSPTATPPAAPPAPPPTP